MCSGHRGDLWVIGWRGAGTPSTSEWPQIEGTVVDGDGFAIVSCDYQELTQIIAEYLGVYIAGHPQDGIWIDRRGKQHYIANGKLVSLVEFAKAMSLSVENVHRVVMTFL